MAVGPEDGVCLQTIFFKFITQFSILKKFKNKKFKNLCNFQFFKKLKNYAIFNF